MPGSKDKSVYAYSAYTRAINYLIQNNEVAARKELEALKEAWAKFKIKIDVDNSLVKMKQEIARLHERGVIHTDAHRSQQTDARQVISEKLNIQIGYSADSSRRNVSPPPTSLSTTNLLGSLSTSIWEKQDLYEFDKHGKITEGMINLGEFSDQELYEHSAPLTPDTIRAGQQVFLYNNVAYKGYAPDLRIKFKIPLSDIHSPETRLPHIEHILTAQGIKLKHMDKMNAMELIQAIAKELQQKDIPVEIQEEKLEYIIRRITQALLNETNVTEDYILDTSTQIHGRNYGHVGISGGLLNTLFANIEFKDKDTKEVAKRGAITTDNLLKIGAADCRGTNCTFAALLNIGYEALGSPKQARLLYTKMAHGSRQADFKQSGIDDHNIVLVQDRAGNVIIRDAYFEHVDKCPLREAIEGKTQKGSLTRNENAISRSVERYWAFQIPAAPPYPPQQTLAQYARERKAAPFLPGQTRPAPKTTIADIAKLDLTKPDWSKAVSATLKDLSDSSSDDSFKTAASKLSSGSSSSSHESPRHSSDSEHRSSYASGSSSDSSEHAHKVERRPSHVKIKRSSSSDSSLGSSGSFHTPPTGSPSSSSSDDETKRKGKSKKTE